MASINATTYQSPPAVVGIVDDDRNVRMALRMLLEAAGHTVAVWPDADGFLASAGANRLGCLLLDVRLPGMSGIDLQARLHEIGTELPVIVISGHADVASAVRSMKLGAFDFVQKPCDPAVLLATVRAALAHDAECRAQRTPHTQARQRLALLSARERDVFEGVIAGLRNKCIAAGLGIAESTVEVHRRHLMSKLGARSLTDLVQLHHAAGTSGTGQPPPAAGT